MPPDLELFGNILETYSLATGVPAFLMDGNGAILQASRGFSPQEFEFADQETFRHNCIARETTAVLTSDRYYTFFTDNHFIYSYVPIQAEQGWHFLVSGPLRFRSPDDQQLVALLKSNRLGMEKKSQIAEIIGRLPEVSMSRLDHLGRVLWSLGHAYTVKGTTLLISADMQVQARSSMEDIIPKITFTLVEEGIFMPLELIRLVQHILLTGDVAGARALREQYHDLPFDRLIENNDILSLRANLISACGGWVGVIFDLNLPWEQIMTIHEQYIRLGMQSNSIPELVDLIFGSVEAFAWVVRKYSGHQYTRPVRQVLQYIQSHMAAKINLGVLASLTGLSPSYLSRLIKKEMGTSLMDLIASYRIEESKYLLSNTRYSILRIAEMVGFTYQNHFSMCFKKYTGITPTRFRQAGGRRA